VDDEIAMVLSPWCATGPTSSVSWFYSRQCPVASGKRQAGSRRGLAREQGAGQATADQPCRATRHSLRLRHLLADARLLMATVSSISQRTGESLPKTCKPGDAVFSGRSSVAARPGAGAAKPLRQDRRMVQTAVTVSHQKAC
jgi:hypothetical protein